ncbi:MAG: CpXC domain-containing protein [Myxococcota bacterium]|nr:CpXC domain-containing protein [Myxococcota bacterium]
MNDKVFAGEMGQTRTEMTTVWCGGCGSWFGAHVYRSIDAEADEGLLQDFRAAGFESLNKMACSECTWTHIAREPIAIHYPSKRKIFLLIPENLRHRAQRIRANFIEDVSRSPGKVVPLYVLEPVLVGGHAELCRILAERETGLNEVVAETRVESVELEKSPANLIAEDVSDGRRRTKSLDLLAELLEDDEPIGNEPAAVSNHSKPLPGLDLEAEDVQTRGAPGQSGRGRLTRETTGVTLKALLEEDTESSRDVGTDVVDTAHELSRTPIDESLLADKPEPSPIEDIPTKQLEEIASHAAIDDQSVASAEPAQLDSSATAMAVDSAEGTPEGRHSETRDDIEEFLDDTNDGVDEQEKSTTTALGAENRTTLNTDAAEVPEPLGGTSKDDLDSIRDVLPEASKELGLRLEDDAVIWRLDSVDFDEPEQLRCLFQKHQFESGVGFCLTLTRTPEHEDASESKAVALTVFDPANPAHDDALHRLSNDFRLRIEFTSEGDVVSSLSVHEALASNVKQAIDDSSAERTKAALDALNTPTFEPLAGIRHSFSEGQFGELLTAAETHIALSIVSYWSQPELTEHLLYRLGFPKDWWVELQRRCCEAAIHFGLYTGASLRGLMQKVGNHNTEEQLLKQLLGHYVEVNLNLRPNELDPVTLWENWDQLLVWADSLGIAVDAQVEEVAAQALNLAENFAEDAAEPSDESYEAIEVSLADAIDIKSLGAFNLQLDSFFPVDSPSKIIEPAMGELSDSELLQALKDPERRTGACVQLIAREPSAHSAAIFDAILLMNPMELVVVVPSILPVADVFVPLFRRALSADEGPPRMAAAMLLAEVGDERAFNPLLGMMLEADEEHWEFLAASVARLGASVVQPALSRARVDQAGLARIAVLLGYAASEAPGCLDGLDRHSDDPAVIACIGQARAVANKLGRPETPPFAHRLAALFEAVQHGSVSLNASDL